MRAAKSVPLYRAPDEYVFKILQLPIESVVFKHDALEVPLPELLLVPKLRVLLPKPLNLKFELTEHAHTCLGAPTATTYRGLVRIHLRVERLWCVISTRRLMMMATATTI